MRDTDILALVKRVRECTPENALDLIEDLLTAVLSLSQEIRCPNSMCAGLSPDHPADKGKMFGPGMDGLECPICNGTGLRYDLGSIVEEYMSSECKKG